MRCAWCVAHVGDMRNTQRILVWKHERKRHLEIPGHRWQDNVKMDLKEIGWEDVDWFQLAQDDDQWQATVNMVLYLRVP